jgi:Domain of unknown function (DUF4136)
MNGRCLRFGIFGLAALAAGCATDGSGGGMGPAGISSAVSVTRFHLGQPIARGEIAVEPLDPAQGNDPNFPRYAAAVEGQLQTLGWTIARGNARSEQVALVGVDQGTREDFGRRSGLSIGLGGGVGFGGRHSGGGVGLGASVPVGRSRAREVVTTQLAVRLQRRSDGTAIWEGRAQSEARTSTPAADRVNAVTRLAPALFQGFPGESGRTIRVR